MLCPNCQHDQSEHAKFCANCGQPLAQPGPAQPVWQQQPAPTQPVWHQAQPAPAQPAYGAPALWGRPIHVWLLVASAVAVIALLLPWYSSHMASSVSWKTTGYEYSDGSRSTWQVPVVSNSSYGGGNGLSFFTLVLAGCIGGLALRFRSGAWPKWAGYTLAAITGLVISVGLINLAFDPNLGPLLFAAAGGLAVPSCLRLLQMRRV